VKEIEWHGWYSQLRGVATTLGSLNADPLASGRLRRPFNNEALSMGNLLERRTENPATLPASISSAVVAT